MRDEVHAHALRAYQSHDLLYLVGQRLRSVFEEHMRLVEEENHLGQLHVAHFGHDVVNLSEQPHQEGRVELGAQHQLVGGKDVHHATSAFGL